MDLTSFCWVVWVQLVFPAHEDVEQQASYHDNHSSYLDTIVVFPAKERTADEQYGTKNDYEGS